ncbi:hypothetical protein BH09MYX1_BH09MYX1_47590 [soil metagenome]
MKPWRTMVVAGLLAACAACQLVLGIERRETETDASTAVDAGTDLGVVETAPPDAGACGTKTACGATCVTLATDPLNCGACGRSCLGGTCTDGRCPVDTIAASISFPNGLLTDGTYLYVPYTSGVLMLTKAGAIVRTLSQGYTFAAAVDDGQVYVGRNRVGFREVVHVPIDGGASTLIKSFDGGAFFPAIAARDQTVVWATGSSGLFIANDDGTNLVTLRAESDAGYAGSVALDDASVFLTDLAPNTLLMTPRTGGSLNVLASALTPVALALGPDDKIYYGDASRVRRVDKAGAKVELLASAIENVGGIGFGGGRVYWSGIGTQTANGEISSRSLTDADETSLAIGQPSPTALVVDAQYVYWISQANNVGQLRRTPR